MVEGVTAIANAWSIPFTVELTLAPLARAAVIVAAPAETTCTFTEASPDWFVICRHAVAPQGSNSTLLLEVNCTAAPATGCPSEPLTRTVIGLGASVPVVTGGFAPGIRLMVSC